MLTVVQAVF